MEEQRASVQPENDGARLLGLSSRGIGALTELLRVLREQEQEILALTERLRRLEPLVWVDRLTGLLNRQGLLQELRREEARARRYHLPAAVAVCAVAELDAVRIRHGPAAADALVRAVAQALRDGSRASDLVARIAEAGFAVVLPGADVTGARAYLERTAPVIRSARRPDGAPMAVRLLTALGTREEAGSLPAALALAEERLRAAAANATRDATSRVDGAEGSML